MELFNKFAPPDIEKEEAIRQALIAKWLTGDSEDENEENKEDEKCSNSTE